MNRSLTSARSPLPVTAAALAILAWSAAPSRCGAQAGGTYGHYEVYESDFLSRDEYAARRSTLLRQLDAGSAMLLRSAEVRNRSGDVDFPYRQRNDMLYLSGVTEEDCALLLLGRPVSIDGHNTREVLFVAERDPKREIWTGIRMGPDAAAAVTGITTVLPYDRMGGVVDSALGHIGTFYYDDWAHEQETEPVLGAVVDWKQDMLGRLLRRHPNLTVQEASPIVAAMRVVKSPAEIALMRRAVEISIEGHRETIRAARPGMWEYELAAIMEYHFHRLGSEAPGYPSIVGSGPNSCILHYETNRRATKAGEMVLMDCGAEYHGYSADVTRTFPISGHFTPEQRAIYDLVYEAQTAGIAECRSGNLFTTPHRKAVEIISAGLKRLGILTDENEYRRYFMHGTSHYLGLDVHDVGIPGKLVPGMVLTVEPGIYIPAGSKCDPKWWNIGVRIEDDILVTDDAPVNLSGALARTAAAIEALMAKDQ